MDGLQDGKQQLYFKTYNFLVPLT